MKRNITFFCQNLKDREAVEPIAKAAKQRNYKISYSDDPSEDAEIGIYTDHRYLCETADVNLSIIMFHGVDQGYTSSMWPERGWRKFDIGLLPGKVSARIWKQNSIYYNPNIGVFSVGWPKSDKLFSKSYGEEIKRYGESLGLKEGSTVLYAPTFESHGKMDDFVEAASSLVDNIMIKHAAYDDARYANVDSLNVLYQQYQEEDDVYILDPTDEIFKPLSVADILVSDESSVLQEAILTNTVPISVKDWPVKDQTNPDFDQVPDFAVRTKYKDLSDEIDFIIRNKASFDEKISAVKAEHFENLGNSSHVIVDLIEAIISDKEPPIEPLSRKKDIQREILYYRYLIEASLPEGIKEKLVKYRIDEVVKMIDKAFK